LLELSANQFFLLPIPLQIQQIAGKTQWPPAGPGCPIRY
jgi:hypothetical protein